MGGMKILFVCSGNTCRSPMAEGLARKMLRIHAESTGICATSGEAAAENAIEVMRSRFGIDISAHRSRNVSELHLDDFDYIVPMDDDTASHLRRKHRDIDARLMESWKIRDPYDQDLEVYESRAKEIQKRVEELSDYLRDKSARKL